MRSVLLQFLCIHAVASDPTSNVTSHLPPEDLTAARGPWWPLRSDRRLELDPECSGGSIATRWRVVVTESAPCADGSEDCPLPEISFGGDGAGGGHLENASDPDSVEFELAEPGPPGIVLISAGSSIGSEERWPLSLDVEYHDGQAGSRWRFYSRVMDLMRPTSEELLTVTLRGDDNRCYTTAKRPSRVSSNSRDASCDSGKGEWLEVEGVRICCREGALWCRKAVTNARKDFATSEVLPPTQVGPERWASGQSGPGLEPSPGAKYRRWDNVGGGSMDELFADPDFVDVAPTFQDVILDFFETPRNSCEDCASELSGYFLAPVTGEYTFKMTSDNEGVLYLGEGDTNAAPEIIARVSDWTAPEQWDQQTGQTSEPQHLVAQTFYPIRGLSNEGGGGDHLRVGVILPDGTPLLPIPVDGYIFSEE
eukprot:COSAG02_NODE_609_length_19574_cov_18.178537_3_plen_424_part_00